MKTNPYLLAKLFFYCQMLIVSLLVLLVGGFESTTSPLSSPPSQSYISFCRPNFKGNMETKHIKGKTKKIGKIKSILIISNIF